MLRGKVIMKRTIEYSIRVFSQKRLPNPEIPFFRIMKNPALKKNLYELIKQEALFV